MSGHDDDHAAAEPRIRLSRELVVGVDLCGLRADVYLSTRLHRLSRTKARRIVLAGDLRRDDVPLRPSQRVRNGDVLVLWREWGDEPEGPDVLAVLADERGLLVLDKPAGLATHPTARYLRSTVTWLVERGPLTLPGQPPPRPCHRLDRETSGVLLLARDLDVERAVKRAFATGRASKTYLALVEGAVDDGDFRVDIPIAPCGELIKMEMRPSDSAPPAITDFRVLCHMGSRTLLECRPRTGRTHQIRAHLALAGFPIVGDKVYGIQGRQWFLRWSEGSEDEEALLHELAWPRQCLHAYSVSLDAGSGVPRGPFVAPWPGDLPGLPPEAHATIAGIALE